MRGRILSFFSLIFLSGSAGGAFTIGILSEVVGLQMSVDLAALTATVVTILVFICLDEAPANRPRKPRNPVTAKPRQAPPPPA